MLVSTILWRSRWGWFFCCARKITPLRARGHFCTGITSEHHGTSKRRDPFALPLVKTAENQIEQPGDAHVAFWDIKNDIDLLEVIGDPHERLEHVKLASTTMDVWEHRCRTFGFPANNEQGIWALGVLLNKDAFGRIQIQDTNDVKGYFIQRGFSGAPQTL